MSRPSVCHSRRCLLPLISLLSCGISTALGQDATTLDAIEVKRQQQPYRDLTVTGATKSPAMIKDLPQSIAILGKDLLEDAGVDTLADALDLNSGISRQSNLGGMWDSYAMRGFTGDPNFGSDYMVNGFNASRGYSGVRDNANVENIEILKGPSSALYGRGEPGGAVNISTKKPLFKPAYNIEVSAGRWDTYRTAVDLTGPLSQSVAYRLNASYQDGHSFRDTIQYDRYMVSPSFLWMISPDTTLSYEVEAVRQRAPFDRGVVAVDGRLGVVPISNFYGEPNDGKHVTESLGHQVFLQHFINDGWSLQTGLSYRESSLEGVSTEVRPYSALVNGETLRRRLRTRDNHALDTSGRFEALGRIETGPVVHNVLFGVDGYRFNDRRLQYAADPSGTTYGIDLDDPVYNADKPNMSLSIHTREEQRSWAYYAQDQMELSERWKALLGVRRDGYDQSVWNLRTGVEVSQSLSATSPRVGLVYQPLPDLSLYATTARSFRPNSGVSRDGVAFDAERGKSYEVGAKLESLGGRLSTTLAVFKITKNNVLTPDPVDPQNYNMAAGEVESKGVELDVTGEIVPTLRLSASYAYTDAEVTEDNADLTGLSLVGRQLANVPKHGGNVLLIKQLGAFSLGGGVQYVGEREGSVAPYSTSDLFVLPSYVSWKLLASWKVNPRLKLSLNVENLFDKEYYVSSYSQYWVYPGAERNFTLSAKYDF
ncbi:MAG TPA: TonB-dependent siderophore receptor [Xanthomonadaceae bacterium]|nr:TonB-dependent siderophore receptor [Xanthomonadaceae bacterium]